MGQSTFLIVAGLVVAGGLLLSGMRRDNMDADMQSARVLVKQEARDAALTGLNLTLRRLVIDEGPWNTPANYQLSETAYRLAKFETFVTPMGVDTVDITAIGSKIFMGVQGSAVDTTHIVEVRIIRKDLGESLPTAFDMAIVTDQDLDIGGTFTVTSLDGVSNADVHANGALMTNGTSFGIDGYGSYTNSESVSEPDNFHPNDDWNGGEGNVIPSDSIEVPPIDLDLLRSMAQSHGLYFPSDVNFSGSDDLGHTNFANWGAAVGAPPGTGTSADLPFVYFSEGSVNITGDTILDGFGYFVSGGDMRINSNVEIVGEIGTNEDGDPVTQMGIFSKGDLTVNGPAEITATLYSDGYTTFNGSATLTGGAVLRDVGKFTGTFNLVWVGPNDGVAKFFATGFRGPIVAAWAEW